MKTLTSILCFGLSGIALAQQQTDTLNIFFDIGKSVIDSNNAKPLDKLIADSTVSSISIYGYTDYLGNAAYNRQLSENRSANVRNCLISKGISKENIRLSKGEGVHPNSAKENRRDLSDKGIQAHRMVRVVYATKSQATGTKGKLSEENLVVNNRIVLENILFSGGSDALLPSSFQDLKELLETMQKFPTLKIEIEGHICCTKDDNVGEQLSIDRAKAVRNYLVKKGIDPARMTYKGYASTRKRYPLEQNAHEEALNRRVEILILEK